MNGPSPRVDIAHARNQQYQQGTTIYKELVDPATNVPRIYQGIVTGYKRSFYQIIYEDGDHKDMTPAQVGKHTAKPRTNAANIYSNSLNDNPFNTALHKQVLKTYAVTHHKTGQQMEYKQLIKDPEYRETWQLSFSDKIGNLFQGIGVNKDGTQRVKGTNTFFWTTRDQIPVGRIITYARIVCKHRPQKTD